LPEKPNIRSVKRKRRGVSPDVFLYEWDGLRAFLDVARFGSFNEAAERLDVQHSTLSRRITALENAIGRPLLRRSPRGVDLTTDGAELLTVLERFDENLSSVGRWIARGVRGMGQPLSVNIGCTEGLSAYWLTQFLQALRKRNARVCYSIQTALSAEPERGKTFHASVQMLQPADAEAPEQIGTVHFCAMASRTYVSETGSYKPGDHPGRHRWIEYAPFRLMSGSWETWFQRRKIDVAPFAVTNSLVTAVNLVREGAGIGLLPTYMAITMPDLAPIETGLRLKFPIWLHFDPKGADTPEMSAALGLIRAAIDPESMPWFRDKAEPNPDWDAWRKLHAIAIGRLA
jgi:DNA-binding transcriptional LysR family regulator